MRLTLDDIPPEMPFGYSEKRMYEKDLYEIIKNKPIPEEDIKNNTKITSRHIPSCYNHVFLNLECEKFAKITYTKDEKPKQKTCSRSNIVRCCIMLGHSVFQHNDFIKNFIEEFEDNARYSKSVDESELFNPNNNSNFLENQVTNVCDPIGIYTTSNVISWVDSHKSLFNMSRQEMFFLLFCIGAMRIPNKEDVYQNWAIQNMENIINECSTHILKRRIDVETFYKVQELKKTNIFKYDIIL